MRQDDYIMYGFIILIGIIIWIIVVRFAFRIKRIVRNQEATIRLLEQIALASNVKAETIREIEMKRTETFADYLGVTVPTPAQSSAK